MTVFQTIAKQLLRIDDRLMRLETVEYRKLVMLSAPLTSTSWDGDSYSDTAKTLIDLSAVFGAPAGIQAVLLYVYVQDSGSASNDTYLILSPNDTASQGIYCSPLTVNDRKGRYCLVVPCSTDGDIYYQVEASGAGTFDVGIQIWGYWK